MEIKLTDEEVRWVREVVEDIDDDTSMVGDWLGDAVDLIKLIDTKIRFPKAEG